MAGTAWKIIVVIAACAAAEPCLADRPGAPAPASAAPEYGTWGFDAAGEDASTRPGDDFFRFVNGTWLDQARIPPDKPAVSLRLAMTDKTEARLHELLESAASKASREPADTEGKVGAYYKAFMDEARIEALGASPIAPELAAVAASRTRAELAAIMGRNTRDFEPTLFAITIDVDLKDPARYAVYLSQSGLGLPDRDYYLEPRFAPARAKYQAYVVRLLQLLEWPDASARGREIVAFETALARASWTKVEQRDVVATYNPLTVDALQAFVPSFPWRHFLAHAELGDVDRVVLNEKSAFPRLAAVYAKTPVATIKAWEAFHIADNAAPYLSRAFTGAFFELHGRTLSGQQEEKPRWKRAVAAVGGGDFLAGDRLDGFGTLGWAVGKMYTDRYFPPASKALIEALVADVKEAYRVRIENLDWMSPATKAEALRKLQTYTIKVGYPEHVRDYARVLVTDDDLVGDVRSAAEGDWAFTVGRITGPVDRSDWAMTPQTNDAYNGNLRDIVFPAAILQAPGFDAHADPAINYGAIGGVIGHELTHGFDDEGRKIDEAGALRDWWTAEDAAKFEARARALGAQYSTYEAIAGARVNGALTMGENIADLGGLTLALDAYHASLKGAPAPVIDGLSGDQRVFLGWAQFWRGKVTDDFVRKQVVSDPHAPRQFRVNGIVRNIDAWYDAFGVTPQDKLYLAPKDRVHIW
jgi:putative endopeptidase